MAIIDSRTPEELNEEFGEIEEQLQEQELSETKGKILGWGISAAIHLTILSIMYVVVFGIPAQKEDPPATKIAYIAPLPETKDNEKKNIDINEKVTIVIPHDEVVTAKETVISDLVPVDKIESESDEDKDKPLGRDEAISDSEQGGVGAFTGIGAGGGGKGLYGFRDGGNRKRQIGSMYGPNAKKATDAIDDGLRWLKRHQSPNGMWSAVNYNENCDDGMKCEPGKGSEGSPDVAMTGYALLCFSGSGYDHKTPSKYKTVLSNAISYLLSIQGANGEVGKRNYEHSIATMALCEAYGMTGDVDLKEPCQKAVNILVQRQAVEKEGDPYAKLGWNYITANPGRNDLSVSGWSIMALKSAVASNIDVGDALQGSKNFIDKTWKAANPNWNTLTDPYTATSVFPYTYDAITGKTDKNHLSFVGSCAAVFLGHRSGDIMLESLLNDSETRYMNNDKFKTNAYALYYISISEFQAGRERFNKFQEKFVPWVLDIKYNTDDCFNGTWNYPKQDFHGYDTSRVLMHCYFLLSLEVVFRYNLVNKK